MLFYCQAFLRRIEFLKVKKTFYVARLLGQPLDCIYSSNLQDGNWEECSTFDVATLTANIDWSQFPVPVYLEAFTFDPICEFSNFGDIRFLHR